MEPVAVDRHDREPGGDRRLGLRLIVPEHLDPLIPNVPQLRADLVGDPPDLPLADWDLSARSDSDFAAASNDVSRAAARTILPRIVGEKSCESSRKLGRRGKKIPATRRVMTDRFVVANRSAADLNGSRVCDHEARPRTLRTRLVIAEELQLSFQGPPRRPWIRSNRSQDRARVLRRRKDAGRRFFPNRRPCPEGGTNLRVEPR